MPFAIYDHAEKIVSEIEKHLKRRDSGSPDLSPINGLDHLHFMGARPVNEALNFMQLVEGQEILDVGSGLGGTARILVQQGLKVVGLEPQHALVVLAQRIDSFLRDTDFPAIGMPIEYIKNDLFSAKKSDLINRKFDGLISLQVGFHIDEKENYFSTIFDLLKPGGKFFSTDFCVGRSADKWRRLPEDKGLMAQMFLIDFETMRELALQAGFDQVDLVPLDKDWLSFMEKRSLALANTRAKRQEKMGSKVVEELDSFFEETYALFKKGYLSGVQLKCCK